MAVFAQINDWQILDQLLSSVFLFIVVMSARWLLLSGLRRWNLGDSELKRRWMVHVKNVAFIIFALGLFVIWATELRTFALSVAAIGAALAISMKEMILCFLGGMYKASVRPFDLGDRISIGDVHGEVIDHDLVSTTLLEIGPGKDLPHLTGRQITLPNAQLLSLPVINESNRRRYVLHTFKVPLKRTAKWKKAEQALTQASREICAPHLDAARHQLSRMGEREALEVPSVEPQVSIRLSDMGLVQLIVRVPVPGGRLGQVEQQILRRYLELLEEPRG